MEFSLNIKGKLVAFDRPVVMGILNLTPDSFHAASRADSSTIGERVCRMIAAGAQIIDVGCCSTRPGAKPCDEATELKRLHEGMQALGILNKEVLWSIDTFRASVAREAVVKYDFDIVNDVSGGDGDKDMISTVAALKVPYVLTHPGNHFGTCNPADEVTESADITAAVLRYFAIKLKELSYNGIADVILDPGFGFGKSLQENFNLLENLQVIMSTFRQPLLVGVSRKSMVTKTLGVTPEEALNGTAVFNTIALMKGASILRVHDVAEATQAINLMSRTTTNSKLQFPPCLPIRMLSIE